MSSITVTTAQMAKAFEAWENNYRTEPKHFLSAEETAAMDVTPLSADRATYFRELLDEVASGAIK